MHHETLKFRLMQSVATQRHARTSVSPVTDDRPRCWLRGSRRNYPSRRIFCLRRDAEHATRVGLTTGTSRGNTQKDK